MTVVKAHGGLEKNVIEEKVTKLLLKTYVTVFRINSDCSPEARAKLRRGGGTLTTKRVLHHREKRGSSLACESFFLPV